MNSEEKKKEFRKNIFISALKTGLNQSGVLISKVSTKTCKAVQGGPVEELARNVDNTIQTFVKEAGDGSLMRFEPMAQRILDLLIEQRYPKFSLLDGHQKIQKMGIAYGYMAGTAVLTTCTNIFIQQGRERLAEREDLNDEAKKICLSYINDAFTVILMELSKNLDSKFKMTKRDRQLFAGILSSNEWLPSPVVESSEAPTPELAPENKE